MKGHKLLIVAVVFITAILFCHNLITGKYYWTNFRAFGETEVETSFNQIGEFSKFIMLNLYIFIHIYIITNELYFIK